MRFYQRVMLAFLAVSIAAVAMLATVVNTMNTRTILAREKRVLTEKSQIVAHRLDDYFEKTRNLVLMLGMDERLRAAGSYAGRSDALNRFLDEARLIAPEEYSAIFLTDAAGTCVASTDRRFVGTDYSFRSYFPGASAAAGRVYASEFSIGLRSLVPGVFFSLELTGAGGAKRGVLILKISGDYLQGLVEALNDLPDGGNFEGRRHEGIRMLPPFESDEASQEIFVLNSDGIVILHPDRDRLFRSTMPLPAAARERILEERVFLEREIESLDEPVLADLHASAMKDRKAFAAAYRDGKGADWKVLALAPLTGNGWCVGVSQDYDDFGKSARDMTASLVPISVVVLVVSLSLSVSLTRIVTRPMEKLMQVMRDVTQRKWDSRVEIGQEPEFDPLCRRFNELLDILERYSKSMEDTVSRKADEVVALQGDRMRLRLLEEREGMYRDLHDSLGARLTSIGICNSVVRCCIRGDPAKAEEMAARIEENCDGAIGEMRALAAPPAGGGGDLGAFAEAMADRLRGRAGPAGMDVAVSVGAGLAGLRLRGEAAREIAAALDEMTTNAIKHSGGGAVSLSFAREGRSLAIGFADDGRGLTAEAEGKGMGLGNIERRISKIGGTCARTSGAGQGVAYAARFGEGVFERESEG